MALPPARRASLCQSVCKTPMRSGIGRGWRWRASCSPRRMLRMRTFGSSTLAGAALLSLALACSGDTDITPPTPPVADPNPTPVLDPPLPPLLPAPPECVPAPVDHFCGVFTLNFHSSSSWPRASAYRLQITPGGEPTYYCSLTSGGDAADECTLSTGRFSVNYESVAGALTVSSIVIPSPGPRIRLELGTAAAPSWIFVDQELARTAASPCERCTDGGYVTPASVDVVVPEQLPGSPEPGDAGLEPGDAAALAAPDAASDAGTQ